MAPSTWASSPAASLLAQPAQAAYSVRRFFMQAPPFGSRILSDASRDSVMGCDDRAQLLRASQQVEEPVQLGLAGEFDIDAAARPLAMDGHACAERDLQTVLGGAGIRVGAARRCWLA